MAATGSLSGHSLTTLLLVPLIYTELVRGLPPHVANHAIRCRLQQQLDAMPVPRLRRVVQRRVAA